MIIPRSTMEVDLIVLSSLNQGRKSERGEHLSYITF